MQIVCITSSVIVMTSSVATVIPGHGLKCDNRIAANIIKTPYSNFKLDFPYERADVLEKKYCIKYAVGQSW